MIRINENYLKLKASYLFSDIAKRIAAYQEANPDSSLIKLGIGDVTEPLPQACRDAFHKAIDEMGTRAGFHGYGPEQGYAFLREAIAANDYQSRGADISADEVFVSDGAKCDSGNFQEIFADDIKIAIPDPVYPVYVDTNVMAGRTGDNVNDRYEGFVYLESTPENGYVPAIPQEKVDLIYLCFPNNPTGATATKAQLEAWVDYAKRCGALILFDAAYVGFVRDESLPQSIYEIEGAKEVAIEFRSFSKNGGFTGTRCAYTVVPEELTAQDASGKQHSVHALWNRRHCTKFNGVSYPVQKAAEAIFSEAGKAEVKALTDFYLENAKIVRNEMEALGFDCVGGDNSPYVWINAGRPSWDFFDILLNEAGVACTPGAGFGSCGEGHIRISAFNSRENVETAMARIKAALSENGSLVEA
ncbi:MAG: LL-diaminopimelate aminotransferase [Opitutales bacterium TMED158]|nr:MAG: LL-diaminopimelate aminotransferase [Opitutales bacterium TMED158]